MGIFCGGDENKEVPCPASLVEAGGTVLNMPTEYLVCILFLYSLVKDSRQNIVTGQSSS